MNAISFSLFGASEKYCIGAIKNVILAVHYYPGWKCFFFTDNSVPLEVIGKLTELGAIIRNEKHDGLCGYLWRFKINDLPGVDRYLIRDTDSRINAREVTAVNEWIKSGRNFHLMRDHPHHKTEIMGGMWGAVKGAIPNIANLISRWNGLKADYFSDQSFLRETVWPLVKHSALQHDNYGFFEGAIKFPTKLTYDNLRFVGEVFDENDNPRDYDWEYLINFVDNGAR